MRLTWAQPEDLLVHEFVASREQRREVADLEARWTGAGGSLIAPVSGAGPEAAPPALRRLARDLLAEIETRPIPADPDEPDDLAAILLAARRYLPERYQPASEAEPGAPGAGTSGAGMPEEGAPPSVVSRASAADYAQRVRGAWYGRAAGCLLGKPVEKIPRAGIEQIARATGNWPISRYFTAQGLPADIAARWPWNRRSAPTSLEENIAGMPEDDDLNYPILGLALLEEHGWDLTTQQVGEAWLANLPAGRVFTAERAAYRNLLEARDEAEWGSYLNPFRQWIGALIRGDVFGWVCPGDPVAAAELAWRDAYLSHRRAGIYGEMWVAAMTAGAMVVDSVDEVLAAGRGVIPPDSRFAAAVRRGEKLGARVAAGELTSAAALDELHARFGHLHWVHCLNNAATVSFALTAGQGDFAQSIALAVTAGWDTDSVGATVGALTGALAVSTGLPSYWIDPLRGRVATSLPGPEHLKLDELAARTVSCATDLAARRKL